jgi:hypothetical protein
MSNIDDIDKLSALSSTRMEEIKTCTKTTFCYRQNWVEMEKPSLTAVMKKFPKFTTHPEMVLIFFLINYYFAIMLLSAMNSN